MQPNIQKPTIEMEQCPDLSSYPNIKYNKLAYNEGFEHYRKKANDETAIQDWINEEFEKRVVNNIARPGDGKTLKVLGIGSGDGKFEFEMLERLGRKFPFIECTVVEPSEKRINLYKNLVDQRKHELKNVTWIWNEKTLEEFLEGDSKKTFDLMICVHVLYCISATKIDVMMGSLSRLLTKEGQLLIIHTKESKQLKLLDKVTSNRLPVMAMGHRVIRHALLNLNMAFVEEATLQTVVDVTECFDKNSIGGGSLLDFIVRTDPQWRMTGTPGQIDAVLGLLKEGCIQSDGKWIFQFPTSVMLCQNNN